jgi:general stress protein 26
MTKQSCHEKLWSLIKKHRFAMLTTLEGEKVLRSRPMTTVNREFDGTLWFFAKADSASVAALRTHPEVCLSYSDPGSVEFVSAAGPGVVITDVAKKQELWNAGVQAWFPEGAMSPLNVLISVTPDHAEYWDSSDSKLVQLFGFAKALITNQQPRDVGEHREVAMATDADTRPQRRPA